jgi:tetratricopeptide (TPR) repeat protein
MAAVLVAHGPAGDSLTALRHLTELIGDPGRVALAPGTAPGLTAAERASERGHHVAADHGPRELADLIGAFEGPVMVVHDDVVIKAEAAANLLASHERTGRIAVPTADTRRWDKEIDATNVSCAVGRAADLEVLAAASGLGPGLVAEGDFVEAAFATMVHTGHCQRRLVERSVVDEGKPGRPLLVAGMIVRDEEEHIGACLEALAGVVDRIEIADTGSLDRTIEIATEWGANVTTIDWRDDFAWARNQVLDRCRDAAYMLWVDADERLVCPDPAHLRQVLATYERLYPAYVVEIRNLDDAGHEASRFMAKRIIDANDTHFEGSLHEVPRRDDGTHLLEVKLGGISIDHHGYASRTMEKRSKRERNLAMARERLVHNRDTASAVHYARSLKATSSDPRQTLEEIEPLIELTLETDDLVRSLMLSIRAELNLLAGDLDAAVESAQAALALVPADDVARAVLAEALLRAGRPDDALASADQIDSMASPTPLVADNVAAATRARALFDAALETADTDRALGLVGSLPADFDPWPALSEHVEVLDPGVASIAGALDDGRYIAAVLSRPDATARAIRRLEAEFTGAGGRIADMELWSSALRDLDRVDAAPDLREAFVMSGTDAAARAYAEAAAAGQVDLLIDLERQSDGAHPVAEALSVAALAHRRRGRESSAMVDAAESLRLWPAGARAALVIAETELDAGSHQAAVAASRKVRGCDGFELNPVSLRDQLIRAESVAHARGGRLAAAVGELIEVVEHGGAVEVYPELLAATGEDLEALALVLGLALLTDGEEFVAEVARANPDAVTTGILAALMTGQDDVALVVAGHAHLLPTALHERLEHHLREQGASVIADHLPAATTASHA